MKVRGQILLCLLVLTAFVASPARADRVAVMVPPRTADLPKADVAETGTDELARLLRWDSFSVISPGQASASAESQQQRGAFPADMDPLDCVSTACAEEYRKLFDGLFAVQLSIVTRNGRLQSVSVVMTEDPKSSYSATARIEGNDVPTAVREAYASAREKQRLGVGPWLAVSGDPEHATVYLDRVEIGHIPLERRRVSAGSHELEVRAEGYTSDVRTIEIPANGEHHERVAVSLRGPQQLLSTPAEPARLHIHRSLWDWVLGGTLVGVGAAHYIAGIVQKSREGDCAERSNGVCTEVYGTAHGAQRDNMLIGFGAATMAVGGLVMGFGPIGTLSMRADKQSAQLELRGKF